MFDIHVIDTDTQSYVQHSVDAVLASAEREKKRKYSEAAMACHASFSHLCYQVMDEWDERQECSQSGWQRNWQSNGKDPTMR